MKGGYMFADSTLFILLYYKWLTDQQTSHSLLEYFCPKLLVLNINYPIIHKGTRFLR